MRNILIILFISAISLVSCKHDRNDPGRAYFPDMVYSHAYEAFSPNPVFEDGQTMQLPVEGTIPREMIPYQYEKTFDDQQRAGIELVNPMEVNAENLKKGREQYDIFCVNCHGQMGKGDGYLYTSKLFPAKPTSLRDDYVQNKPDGEIYHVLTLGSLSGLMGAHGSQISPENRWKIVSFIKNDFKTK